MSKEELLNNSDSKTGFAQIAAASPNEAATGFSMENAIVGFPDEYMDEGLKNTVTAINAAESPSEEEQISEAETTVDGAETAEPAEPIETSVAEDPASMEGAQEESPEERWARLESLEAEVKQEAEERKLQEAEKLKGAESQEAKNNEETEPEILAEEETADTNESAVSDEASAVSKEEASEPAEPEFEPMTEKPEELSAEEKAEIEAQNIAEGNMSLVDHLTELRKRLIRMILSITLGTGVAYFFLDEIMHHLMKPAGKLYYMQPAEAFFVYLKVCIFAGFLLAVPIVFYQGWKFLLPALTKHERRVMGIVLPSSVLLFFGGITFSFLFVLPAGIKFFMGFGNEDLAPMFSIDKYISFVIAFVLPFGVIFELPLVIVILAKLGFVSSALLRKYRKIVIFAAFVIGAVISPTPDVFSQSMIAIPMFLLYEASIIIVRFVLRK